VSGRVFSGILSLLGVDIRVVIEVEVGAEEDRKVRTGKLYFI
jgi:hypothetical protein